MYSQLHAIRHKHILSVKKCNVSTKTGAIYDNYKSQVQREVGAGREEYIFSETRFLMHLGL